MLLCDLSACGQPAVVIVHFKDLARAHPYCSQHAYNRRGELVFRQRRNGVWISPVRHVERLTPTREVST